MVRIGDCGSSDPGSNPGLGPFIGLQKAIKRRLYKLHLIYIYVKKIILIASLLILIIFVSVLVSVYILSEKTPEVPVEVHDQNVSGEINQDQIWDGNILVTGDITVNEDVTLTILPGTIITVTAFSDDQQGGVDHPHDLPFPKDPDRKETASTVIRIDGVLNALGTVDKNIIFTSDKKQTTYDWDGLYLVQGKLDYVVLEYARYNKIQETSDVIISNSIIRNSLECCLCIGHYKPVSPQILNNDIYNCGHEGIDIGGGSPIIKGNYFHLENPEIQPDVSIGKNGVIVYQNTYPIIENNTFEKLSVAVYFLEDPKNQKEEDKKVIVKNNTIKNNEAAFGINPGFPMKSVLMENNDLINNTEEKIYESRD